ncbi:MAG: hypothetical protein OXI24_11785 [Candidatus Poribacteria bacterium]|nr:hypothetical protein [Candidatus Poribacteria bacterium]
MSGDIAGITHEFTEANGIRLHYAHGGKSRRKCIEVGGNSLSHPRDYIPNPKYV